MVNWTLYGSAWHHNYHGYTSLYLVMIRIVGQASQILQIHWTPYRVKMKHCSIYHVVLFLLEKSILHYYVSLFLSTLITVCSSGCILHLTLSEESASAKSNCSHEEECANTKDDGKLSLCEALSPKTFITEIRWYLFVWVRLVM